MGLYAWCNHGLKEHCVGTGRIIERPEEYVKEHGIEGVVNCGRIKRIVDTTINRLVLSYVIVRNLDYELTDLLRGLFKDIMLIAVSLHDVGKALSVYQKEFHEYPSCERVSLTGHELFSAWIVNHIVKSYLIEQMDKISKLRTIKGLTRDLSLIASIGVALHHSARRSLDDALNVFKSTFKYTPSLNEFKFMIQFSYDILKEFCISFDEEYARGLICEYYKPRFLSALVDEILGFDKRLSKMGELIAYVTSIADNLDSCLHRRRERGDLNKAVIECACIQRISALREILNVDCFK